MLSKVGLAVCCGEGVVFDSVSSFVRLGDGTTDRSVRCYMSSPIFLFAFLLLLTAEDTAMPQHRQLNTNERNGTGRDWRNMICIRCCVWYHNLFARGSHFVKKIVLLPLLPL